jgi:hypothetical protein
MTSTTSDLASQPPSRPRPAPNPRAAPQKEHWSDRLTVEGRYRLNDLEAAKAAREQGKG